MEERLKISCLLPKGHKHQAIIKNFEYKLALRFGGFTRLPMLEGWVNPNNDQFKTETGYVYLVTVHPADVQTACNMFHQVAKDIGEKYVFIERTIVISHTIQVNDRPLS